MAKRVSQERVAREPGYLYYLGRDGYLWKTPTKLNKSGRKARAGSEKITREDGYMYFLDDEGFVSRSEMKSRDVHGESPVPYHPPVGLVAREHDNSGQTTRAAASQADWKDGSLTRTVRITKWPNSWTVQALFNLLGATHKVDLYLDKKRWHSSIEIKISGPDTERCLQNLKNFALAARWEVSDF